MRTAAVKREVTVHVPGLLGPWPRALAGEIVRGLDLPGLVGLLARARPAGQWPRSGRSVRSGGAGEPESFERLAFGAFGYRVPAGGGDAPAAALTWERDAAGAPPGGGAAGPDGRSLVPLRADPVHLRPDLDAARLFDSSHFSLSRDEAASMADALARHFAPEGVRFEAPYPTRWYVRVEKEPDAVFRPPGAVAGRGAGGSLPAGNEGAVWRRRMNEAQMVLHAHPANQAREARGELPVNSVWFWGAGAPGPVPRRRFHEVVADDPLIRALAERGGARVHGLDQRPAAPGEAADEAGAGRRLVAPGDGCYRAVAGRDVESWRRELVHAEERWFRPLLDEAVAGRVRKVTVAAGLRTGEAVFEAFGRRARRAEVPAPPGGLAAFLLAEGPATTR